MRRAPPSACSKMSTPFSSRSLKCPSTRSRASSTPSFAPIRRDWLNHAYGLGEKLGVELARERVEGHFKDLDENGVLIVELADGGTRRIAAGDVYLIG